MEYVQRYSEGVHTLPHCEVYSMRGVVSIEEMGVNEVAGSECGGRSKGTSI